MLVCLRVHGCEYVFNPLTQRISVYVSHQLRYGGWLVSCVRVCGDDRKIIQALLTSALHSSMNTLKQINQILVCLHGKLFCACVCTRRETWPGNL